MITGLKTLTELTQGQNVDVDALRAVLEHTKSDECGERERESLRRQMGQLLKGATGAQGLDQVRPGRQDPMHVLVGGEPPGPRAWTR